MDLGTISIFALVALIAANQVLVRLPIARTSEAFFWGLQILDAVLGALVVFGGLPGFEHAPAVSWVVGLLLILHVAQNMRMRNRWEEEERAEARALREEERKARRQAREAEER